MYQARVGQLTPVVERRVGKMHFHFGHVSRVLVSKLSTQLYWSKPKDLSYVVSIASISITAHADIVAANISPSPIPRCSAHIIAARVIGKYLVAILGSTTTSCVDAIDIEVGKGNLRECSQGHKC